MILYLSEEDRIVTMDGHSIAYQQRRIVPALNARGKPNANPGPVWDNASYHGLLAQALHSALQKRLAGMEGEMAVTALVAALDRAAKRIEAAVDALRNEVGDDGMHEEGLAEPVHLPADLFAEEAQ